MKDRIHMNALKAAAITLCVSLVFLGATLAHARPPRWQGGNLQTGPAAEGAVSDTPESFEVQCPTAYPGIKGELLPTGWVAFGKGQPAKLISSQVQDQYLYCVYTIPSTGRQVHSSVQRLIPKGYTCVSDGAGRFECSED
ncbi:MAG: hypothetical protein ACC669_04165 [bacterium]